MNKCCCCVYQRLRYDFRAKGEGTTLIRSCQSVRWQFLPLRLGTSHALGRQRGLALHLLSTVPAEASHQEENEVNTVCAPWPNFTFPRTVMTFRALPMVDVVLRLALQASLLEPTWFSTNACPWEGLKPGLPERGGEPFVVYLHDCVSLKQL